MARTPDRTFLHDLIVTTGDAIVSENGSTLLLHGHDETTAGAGDGVLVRGGDRTGIGAGGGGPATLLGGSATSSGAGGAATVQGGIGIGTNSGGDASLVGGDGIGAGANPGGNLILTPGVGSGGPDGNTRITRGGLRFLERVTVPETAAPTFGQVWVRSDSPNVLIFTDDAGTDHVLNASGGSNAGLPGNIYENLQFYVDPADRNSFPAEGGVVATDLEGNGTAGTLSAAAVFDNGAWTFDGASGDDVRFTKDATLDNIFAGGGTIITVLRPYSSGQGTLGRAIDTTESTTTTGYYLSAHDELNQAVRIRFHRNWTTTPGTWATDNITDAFGSSNRPFHVGDWGVVAVSYDDTATPPVIYLNGTVLAVTETSTPSVDGGSDAGNGIYIGNRSSGLFTWHGQIDTTLMFDRILTADEVQQVTNAFYARRGIGIRGYDAPTGTGNAGGQTILLRAGDSIQSGTGADGGDIILQAGNLESPGDGQAGRILIRSGDQNAGTTGSDQSNVLIESGAHFSGGGNVTVRVGLPNSGATGGNLLLNAGDTTGTAGSTLIRGGGRGSAGASGGLTARGGDGTDFVGGGGNRSGGAAAFRGGDGTGFLAAGGLVTLRGGDADSAGVGGAVIIRSGTSVSADAGDVSITASDAGTFGLGGKITVTAGDTTTTSVGGGGGISFTTGNSPGNFLDFHAGDFTITTGNATGSPSAVNSGAGSFYFTGGTSNGTSTASPGGEFEVTGGAGTANSVNSRGGAVRLTGGAVTGASAATAGGVTLTGGAATTGTGGTISLQPGTGTVADGSLILDYSTYPAADASGVLTSNGAGVLAWSSSTAGELLLSVQNVNRDAVTFATLAGGLPNGGQAGALGQNINSRIQYIEIGKSTEDDIGMSWDLVLPDSYSGNGLTVEFWIMGDGSASAAANMVVAFDRQETGRDIDTGALWGASVAATGDTISATAWITVMATAVLTNGQIDGMLAGESGRIAIMRLQSDAYTGVVRFTMGRVYETP